MFRKGIQIVFQLVEHKDSSSRIGHISYNLRDDFDIDLRIKKAGQAMGALKHFFNNEHVDTYTKYHIFKAIPLNLLLWGCETPELAEKKNLPADNGTQKVSDGTFLIHSECSDLDLTLLRWT